MSTLPGEAPPPKSGCSLRVPPLLMNAMKLAELVSTGADVTSVFHQLSAGNSGSGAGSAAPSAGTVAGHCAAAVAANPTAHAIASRERATSARMPHHRHRYDDGIIGPEAGGGKAPCDRPDGRFGLPLGRPEGGLLPWRGSSARQNANEVWATGANDRRCAGHGP